MSETDAARREWKACLKLARALKPFVHRGALQYFFVSPVLPREPMNQKRIRKVWRAQVADIAEGKIPERLLLYVHIPFCPRLCKYCIYYRVKAGPERIDAYLDHLNEEIRYLAPVFDSTAFSVAYLGGGTPTVLTESQLARLLGMLDQGFPRTPGGEWAFETSPYTLNEKKARLLADHGYNRASFGVQTLARGALKKVGRDQQTIRQIDKTIRTLKKFNYYTNLDLIHGLPGNTLATTLADVERLLKMQPTSITLQLLSPYTPPLEGVGDAMGLEELKARVEPVADRFGYQVDQMATCLTIVNPGQDNLLHRETAKVLDGVNYNDITLRPQSLLGLGPTARSYIYGRLKYEYDPYPVDAPFDPEMNIAMGRMRTLLDDKRHWIVYHLSQFGHFSANKFAEQFQETVDQAFPLEMERLTALGRLTRTEEGFQHISSDFTERFAAELFFVGARKLHAAWQDVERRDRAKGANEEPTLSHFRSDGRLWLEHGAKRLRVALVEYTGQEDCYGHSGGFGFFLSADGFDRKGRLDPHAQVAVEGFSRLFELVVSKDHPSDTAALGSALIARAKKLTKIGIRLYES